MSLQEILAKTDEYLQIPSVIGFERAFIQYLFADFSKRGCEVRMYNKFLTVSKKNSKNPKVLTAHIDRHGIVTDLNGNFEYAAFNVKKSYGINIKGSEKFFKKVGQRFIDEIVYAYNYLSGDKYGEGKVKSFSYDVEKKNLFFEIEGFSDIKRLQAPIPVAYKSQLKIREGLVSSQIDNVISISVIHQLVSDGFDGKIILTAEEEIGRSWKYIVDYLLEQGVSTQEIITLDTTPYDDLRAVQNGLIVLRNKDENGIFNPELVSSLREICESQGIKYEMKDEVIEAQNAKCLDGAEPKTLGKTELGRIIQHTEGRFNGATIQLPTINYHTNHETTSELALNNYYKALKKIL